ncbi:preprotein translocase subunit SecD [Methanococcus aeolicus]|uniref:Protein-export membrane protein SecD n=1 Tax=Methanococcus aeolicus (strain ATCC BAA-1280 / DSM 17508 / OCM 812 / Nankai-3) TaxID=419665 RepID=A6UVS3_META3|nr:preprotein translocase subunit SecD [Methanococcus aeolicus]ABR56595.1 SecD/SecF/SecDF export membrane protein [Methanococcus aeolicus Nankai-3]UXM84602.1 preprotein translocase subunit SecD [Methanococcus aeolicus]
MNLLKDTKTLILIGFIIASVLLIAFKGVSYGVDLSGGSIIVLKTEKVLSESEMATTTEILSSRLNANGLSDISVYPRGTSEIVVEIPKGVDLERIKQILTQQGVFYAKIDGKIAYTGQDVAYVQEPGMTGNGYGVNFKLTNDGAKKFAEVAYGMGGTPVELYMDDKLISSPVLSQGLADGNLHPDQVITVAGSSPTKDDENEAWMIYTSLKSGSLPVKVNIEYISSVSPTLGEEFIKGSIIAGLFAFLAVGVVIAVRYKTPTIVIPILITCISEVLIILGFASLIGWKLDLASIAGIVASVGTGVDDQIVITDETISGESNRIKRSMNRAFFIIFAAAGTTIAAMLPLFFMSIGMLRGFAITTIVGVLIGIFITRPAFASMIKYVMKKYNY